MSVNVANAKGGEHATSRRGGMTPYEIDFVRAQRAKGRSIQTVAKMLGRSQETIAAYVEATEETAVCSVLAPRAIPRPPETAMGIIHVVARRHGFLADDVLAPSARTVIIAARHECFHRLKALRKDDGGYRFTAAQIGSWFDCNHSTVIGGAASHEKKEAKREAADLARWRALGTAA